MKKLFRSLFLGALCGTGAIAGTNLLLAQEKKPPTSTLPILPEKPVGKPAKPALPDDLRDRLDRIDRAKPAPGEKPGGGNPMGDSKADMNVAPVKVGDTIAKTDFAVKPKDLSDSVKKGLEYLVKSQQEDGGWNQGGGWRNNTGGGRVEGAKVEDPSDVGNTCFAMLALLRAGNTATDGKYKDNVKKGLTFIINRVEKADKDSLFVTDVKGTQLQSKIGPYVDTFLVNLVLAEFRGKSGDQEKKLVAALEKTMTKIVRHQTADGGYAGNGGWASTLSNGIANKSIARAKGNGAVVDDIVLKRVLAQSTAAADNKAPDVVGKPGDKLDALPKAGAAGEAGIRLYGQSSGAGNTQDVLNTLRVDAAKARDVLKDPKAPKEEKEKAEKTLAEVKKAEEVNDRVQADLAKQVKNDNFVAGFGNNGGEEFLSFMNISEALLLKGGKDWDDWDAKMVKGLEKAQDKDGSWQGHHCITGKTFCTAGALLVLMADRTPFPVDVLKAAKEKRDNEKKDK